MSYPPYGGGGYPPSGPGYPAAGGSYPPNPSAYPPQPGAGGPGYQPMPSAGMGYPPAPSGPGYPPSGTGYPSAGAGYPPSGTGYPPAPSGTGYPPAQSGMPYPSQPPGGSYPQPTSYNPPPGPGYPSGAAPYPSQGGYPGGGAPQPQPQGGAPLGFSFPSQPGAAPYPGQSAAPSYPSQPAPAPYPSQPGAGQYPSQGYPAGGTGYPGSTGYPGTQSQTGYPGTQSQTGYPASSGVHHQTVGASHGGHTVKEEGTLKPHHPFNGQSDADIIRKAMKGFGTDEKAIIGILTKRTNEQRQRIVIDFKTMYGKDLIKDLKSELSGKLEDVILALLMKSPDYDATCCYNAISGLGTDEDALIEVLCTRTNAEILAMKQSYKTLFRKDLEKDIRSDTSGHFERLLVSMTTGGRDENPNVDVARAQNDAKALYQAGEKKWGTDESKFNSVIAAQSFPQLRQVFTEYQKLTGHTIEKAIASEMSGDLKKGMITIIHCVRDKAGYFAEQLYKSMKGAGTNDRQLIRVVVTRCEKDMVQIKQTFQKNYGKTLESFIQDDTSGDYKRILISLVT